MTDRAVPIAALLVPGWSTPGAAAGLFAGEIALVVGLIGLLVVPFILPNQSNRVSATIALISLFSAVALTGWGPRADGAQFAGALVSDGLARYWKIVLFISAAGVVGLWFCSTRRAARARTGTEFFTLLLGSTLGLALMGGTDHLLTLLLASELASLPTYVLAGFRKDSRPAGEAALKYVLIGALSSGCMVYGLSLLYGVHGSVHFGDVARGVVAPHSGQLLTAMGLLGLFAGLAFKMTAVPMHVWCPDVFDGTGIDVSAFLSVASKGAGLVLTARLLMELAAAQGQAAPGHAITWILLCLAAVAVATMFVGNLGALRQTSVKRLLAYSSIAHAGYLLAALCVFPGTHESVGRGVAVMLIYLAIYAVMNLVAFIVAAEVETTDRDGTLGAFGGLGERSPVLAAAMTAALVSMIGLPPLVGFTAKLKLLAVLGSGGPVGWTIAGCVALNSIISVYFYGRVLHAMYLRPERAGGPPLGKGSPVLAAVGALMLVTLFVWFTPLERWAGESTALPIPSPLAPGGGVAPHTP